MGWVGTGALKYTSAMADSKLTNNTEHVTQKQTLGPRGPFLESPETFRAYFG